MRTLLSQNYSPRVDISFLVGVALGTIVSGFCAIGSFGRGFDSARRRSWMAEHEARKQAVVASHRSDAKGRGRDRLVA